MAKPPIPRTFEEADALMDKAFDKAFGDPNNPAIALRIRYQGPNLAMLLAALAGYDALSRKFCLTTRSLRGKFNHRHKGIARRQHTFG